MSVYNEMELATYNGRNQPFHANTRIVECAYNYQAKSFISYSD